MQCAERGWAFLDGCSLRRRPTSARKGAGPSWTAAVCGGGLVRRHECTEGGWAFLDGCSLRRRPGAAPRVHGRGLGLPRRLQFAAVLAAAVQRHGRGEGPSWTGTASTELAKPIEMPCLCCNTQLAAVQLSC